MGWMKEKWKEETGLTLVEILVSIFIMSLVIISASAAFIYSTKTSGDQQIRLTAINLANERMEHIRSLKFADIGTRMLAHGGTYISGDPAGLILQEETVIINGIEYLIETNITWEEKAEWDLAGSAEWDYKGISIVVTPVGYSGGARLAQHIESYATRDWSQPALPGSNIRIRAVEGWRLPGDPLKVIYGVRSYLESGPSAVRLTQTSSRGIASFIDLTPGSYRIELDASLRGYMVDPAQGNILTVELLAHSTQNKPIEFAKPASLRFILKDISGSIITPNLLDSSGVGKITLEVPPPLNSTVDKNIAHSDIRGDGSISESLFGNLWPVGDGYTGAYAISNVTYDSLHFIVGYVAESGGDVLWNGKFSDQGEMKVISLYFIQAPVTPSNMETSWVDSYNNLLIGDNYALDSELNHLDGGTIQTSDTQDTINLGNNMTTHFNGERIYCENTGRDGNPALEIGENATLYLHGGEIVFRGGIKLVKGSGGNRDGNLVLHTTWQDGYDSAWFQGHQMIGDEAIDTKGYGKLYLAEPIILDGDNVLNAGGYYYPDGIILPNQVNQLIPFTKESYIG